LYKNSPFPSTFWDFVLMPFLFTVSLCPHSDALFLPRKYSHEQISLRDTISH
jgi:hypothetical protein